MRHRARPPWLDVSSYYISLLLLNSVSSPSLPEEQMYSLPTAAVTNACKLSAFKQCSYSLTVLEARSLESRYGKSCSLSGNFRGECSSSPYPASRGHLFFPSSSSSLPPFFNIFVTNSNSSGGKKKKKRGRERRLQVGKQAHHETLGIHFYIIILYYIIIYY